jgi:hypothetical protein
MVRRSASGCRRTDERGAVAQLGERCNRTAEVTGSIPVSSIAAQGTRVTLPAATIYRHSSRQRKFCPPPIGRTESSNDGARGSSGETVARCLNATTSVVAFSISGRLHQSCPRPHSRSLRRASASRVRACPLAARRIRRVENGLPRSRPFRSSPRPRATRAIRRTA